MNNNSTSFDMQWNDNNDEQQSGTGSPAAAEQRAQKDSQKAHEHQ